MTRIILRLLLTSLLLTPAAAHAAATVSLSAQPVNIGKGDSVEIKLSVGSSASVNTFSGTLSYPADLLEPTAINDGSSIVNIWLTRPTTVTESPLAFAGFTPGGFSGGQGKLFSVIFTALRPGQATLTVGDLTILRNDGAGTQEEASVAPLSLAIAPVAQGGFKEPEDIDPPESFSAVRGKDSEIFDGDAYLVFVAADKGSGIAFYEVAERRFPFAPLIWKPAVSPYRITDQYLTSDVYLVAVDRADNGRVTVVHRKHLLRPFEWLILGMLTVLAFWYRRRVRSRSRQ